MSKYKYHLSDIIDASHENKWVAIAPDYSRVIGAADTLRILMTSIADKDAIYSAFFRMT